MGKRITNALEAAHMYDQSILSINLWKNNKSKNLQAVFYKNWFVDQGSGKVEKINKNFFKNDVTYPEEIPYFFISGDEQRPAKIVLMELLDMLQGRGYLEGDLLDSTRFKEMRDVAAGLEQIKENRCTQLVLLLNLSEFKAELRKQSSIRQMEILTNVGSNLLQTKVGTEFLLKNVAETDGLFYYDWLSKLPYEIGFDIREVNDSLNASIVPEKIEEAKKSLGIVENKFAIETILKTFALFDESIMPMLVHALAKKEIEIAEADPEKALTYEAAIRQVANASMDALVPPEVAGNLSTEPVARVKQVRDYLNNNKTVYGNISKFFAAASLVLEVYDAYTSFDKVARTARTDGAITMDILADTANGISKNLTLVLKLAEKLNWKMASKLTYGVSIFMLPVDALVALKGISDSGDLSDRSVMAGHALKFAGSAAFTLAPALVSISIISGPVGWAVAGIGIAVMILGESLILFTDNPPLEDFANVCWYGQNPGSSMNPGFIQYKFLKSKVFANGNEGFDLDKPNMDIQVARLHSILKPIDYQISGRLHHTFKIAKKENIKTEDAKNSIWTLRCIDCIENSSQILNSGQLELLRSTGQVSIAYNGDLVGRWTELKISLPNEQATVFNEHLISTEEKFLVYYGQI